ncbi:DUF4124 domain-containing protein [Ramlibacter sp. 2FC]|uniref:DUF4124 domain-containing protein n=1 Tax=Ramlibacter sp. 2FC TaxID=2502188 RepID=UPI0010F52775|nr:DUF4124 domain-containing protein [Ramlibacter sp. 2FC]
MTTTKLAWVLGLALALPLAASAQWQWIDQSGRRVFSDQPPPAGTPARNILSQPGGQPPPLAATPAPAASAPRPSGQDKGLEEKKQQGEAAEAAKKKAEEERQAAARAENCARARKAKEALDSGVRLARSNEQGEREYMDEAARAAEYKRLQPILDRDCR